jgi:deazaflavin-dependent oxidoreductase (nitroreductase family)
MTPARCSEAEVRAMRLVQRVIDLLFANRVGTAFARRFLPPVDELLFRLTGGRLTLIELLEPALMLETIGARSGQPRHSPLLYVRDGERFVIAGTNFGRAHHPAWTGNLLRTPDAVVVLRGRRVPVVAHPIHDESERARLWKQLDAVYTGYRRYREVTKDIREVRMFALVPR